MHLKKKEYFLVTYFLLNLDSWNSEFPKSLLQYLGQFVWFLYKDAPVTLYLKLIIVPIASQIPSLITTTVRIFWGALLNLAMSALGESEKII